MTCIFFFLLLSNRSSLSLLISLSLQPLVFFPLSFLWALFFSLFFLLLHFLNIFYLLSLFFCILVFSLCLFLFGLCLLHDLFQSTCKHTRTLASSCGRWLSLRSSGTWPPPLSCAVIVLAVPPSCVSYCFVKQNCVLLNCVFCSNWNNKPFSA
uniref:Uncharacterized protein n=1 Tax=Cacopsylla melanoneura TaxID=428564 RepID=A0A8D9ABW5_9HEMI